MTGETATADLLEQVADMDDLDLQFDGTDAGKRFIEAWKRARIIVDFGGGHSNGGTPPPTPPPTPSKYIEISKTRAAFGNRGRFLCSAKNLPARPGIIIFILRNI